MGKGKSIKIVVPDGDPLNPIKIEMSSWLGFAFHIKRERLLAAKNIPELRQCGVYFLYGEVKNKSGQICRKIYIGQGVLRQTGDGVFLRIKEHDTSDPKEAYWTDAVAFVDAKNVWGKTEISYLENRFTNSVVEAKKHACLFEIVNGNNPNPGRVTESMQWELDEYIEGAEVILCVLGFDFFSKEKSSDSAELPFINKQNVTLGASEAEQKSIGESSEIAAEQNNSEEDFPFKIGRVMACAFREALSRGLLNNELSYLESADACKQFKTRGYRVIKTQPEPSRRFAKDPVSLNGKQYWITTQVYKEGLAPLLSYLEQHGMSKAEIIELCQAESRALKSVQKKKQHTPRFSSFREFLQRTMCKSSATNYASSFKDLENILLNAHIISAPLSEATSSREIDSIRDFVASDTKFREYNKARHHSRSAAWRKFEEYLEICGK